jgi:hypothetical protein
VPSQVNQALLTMLSTYPLGSPSGGFTYTIDPALGTLTRSSDSFGPSFAERALTTGRGKVSLGFEYQHAMYDTLEGLNLRSGEVKFYIQHADCCSRGTAQAQTPTGLISPPPFEGDLIEATLKAQAGERYVCRLRHLWHFRSFRHRGGRAVRARGVDASVLAKIERLSTAQDPTVHEFEGSNPDEHTFTKSGSATGIGDIVLRGKYAFNPASKAFAGVAMGNAPPTGQRVDLLGTGGVQDQLFGIASMNHSRFAPHLNLGYTFSSEGALRA